MRCQIPAIRNLRREKHHASTIRLTFLRTYWMVWMFSGKSRGFEKRLELRCAFDINVKKKLFFWNSMCAILFTWNLVSLGALSEKIKNVSTWPKVIWETHYFLKRTDSRFSETIGEILKPWFFQWKLLSVYVGFSQTSVARRGSYFVL